MSVAGALRIGLLGGTFDPIHLGHLIIAQDVLKILDLEKVIFMPSRDPPHKEYKEMAPSQDRLKMVKMAVDGNPCFQVSTMELERGGRSYTFDTLKQMRKDLSCQTEIFLIIGSDNVSQIPTWHNPRGIFELCTVVVASRSGLHAKNTKGADSDLIEKMEFIDVPHIQISSTDIRLRIRQKEPIRYIVPDQVLGYIKSRKLYSK